MRINVNWLSQPASFHAVNVITARHQREQWRIAMREIVLFIPFCMSRKHLLPLGWFSNTLNTFLNITSKKYPRIAGIGIIASTDFDYDFYSERLAHSRVLKISHCKWEMLPQPAPGNLAPTAASALHDMAVASLSAAAFHS